VIEQQRTEEVIGDMSVPAYKQRTAHVTATAHLDVSEEEADSLSRNPAFVLLSEQVSDLRISKGTLRPEPDETGDYPPKEKQAYKEIRLTEISLFNALFYTAEGVLGREVESRDHTEETEAVIEQ
jgi:hypothetical protein